MRATPVFFGAAALQLVAAYENAVYWGANDAENSLATYCASGEGIDVVIVSFLSTFGGGRYPNGYLGSCQVNEDGSGSDECSGVSSDIATCQSNGIKVFVSLGGAGADYSLDNEGDASGVAYSLWNSYANPSVVDSGTPRPLGDVSIDGWDIDLEADNGSQQYLGTLLNSLRGYFANDTSKTYYISGAPQCPIPDTNMGNSIMEAQYDYLFIQFYNNNCAASDLTNGSGNPDGDGEFNFSDWPGYVQNGTSSGAKLFVGIPADPAAAGDYFYIQPSDLPTVLGSSEGVDGFAGFMLYDAGATDTENDNGCNYAQQARSVLDNGSPCS